MNVLERALEEIESEKCLMTELLEDDEYRKGYIAGMAYAHGIASEYANEVATSQNKVVVDILNGLADWWHTEAPIDEGEEKSETLKVLEQVQEYVESFLDEEVEKKSGWIPVSERLPEERKTSIVIEKKCPTCGERVWRRESGAESETVWTCIKYKTGEIDYASSRIVNGKWSIERTCGDVLKVIAWQPLPEPYEEESRS